MVAIFLELSNDRDGHLHSRTMEETYGPAFCFSVQSSLGKSYMSALFSLFSAIFAGPRFFQIQKLLEIYYHGNVT